MLKRPVILCAGLLLTASLLFGVTRLFELRLDRGDLYPPYSTLRSDPLGASVLYESLERVPGVSARRYFEGTFKLEEGQSRALFVLGAEPYSMRMIPRSEFEVLQRFVFGGGRIVIAYFPEVVETYSSRRARLDETNNSSAKPTLNKHAKPDTDNSGGKTNCISGTNSFKSFTFTNEIASLQNTNSASRTNDSESTDDEDFKQEMKRYCSLSEEWGVDCTYKNLGTNRDGKVEFPLAHLNTSNPHLPAAFTVHTALCFTNLTNGWTTIYQRDKKTPVVVERKFGAGSVVLVADSYPLSNEAMFKDRSAGLVAWLLDGGRDAIFDEAHLGVVEEPGVATLMRRYQLHGLIFSLLVVAALFIWKNSSSLVPPVPEADAEAETAVAGRDSASGFVNLLRRGISPTDIINICFGEWKKSGSRQAAISAAQRREVEQIVKQQAELEPRQRKPVESYRNISRILKQRK